MAEAERGGRPSSYLVFFSIIAAIVFLIHAPLLQLPFYWDELGQFIPASLDLFQSGRWIPYSTVPNIHPPGLMAYLAAVWHVTGYSIPITRAAMLLLASFGAFFTFLLSIRLGNDVRGFPAFTALLLLCLSPLFVAQATLAQLDMPAMMFTVLAMIFFFLNRMRSAALACTALVMIKETGIVAPAVFGFVLLSERRWREAVLFAAPLLPLGVWLAGLHRSTGHWGGNASFEAYNIAYTLTPVRFTLALLRRGYYLFIGTGHWIGTAAVIFAIKHTPLFRSREWRVVAFFAAAHVLLVTVFGGAVLERYLLPVLPFLYIAFAVAFSALPDRLRPVGTFVLMPLFALANFLNPLYPFAWENNLAFVNFVSLHQKAADFVENTYGGGTIATMFPLAGALRRSDFGYVRHAVNVREVRDFTLDSIRSLRVDPPDALVVYSTAWDPLHTLEQPAIERALQRYYDYRPQATGTEIQRTLGMRSVARWSAFGQWVEVFEGSHRRGRATTVELLRHTPTGVRCPTWSATPPCS